MIKAIIFDCFGVLTNDGWKEIREEYCTTPEKSQEAHDIDIAANNGGMSYDDFIARIVQLTGLSTSEINGRIDTRRNNEQLFIYIRDTLKPKYSIGLLSNAADNWLRGMFEPWQVQLFDAVTLSYAVGAVKPQPEIYYSALSKLGVESAEAIFVDDVERYCEGARAVGMKAVLYNDFDDFKEKLESII